MDKFRIEYEKMLKETSAKSVEVIEQKDQIQYLQAQLEMY